LSLPLSSRKSLSSLEVGEKAIEQGLYGALKIHEVEEIITIFSA
jgi:hypothetical protein